MSYLAQDVVPGQKGVPAGNSTPHFHLGMSLFKDHPVKNSRRSKRWPA